MANEARSSESAVVVQLVPLEPLEAGEFGIALLIRKDLIVELYGVDPWPGVILQPADARALADRLRLAAEKLEARGARRDE